MEPLMLYIQASLIYIVVYFAYLKSGKYATIKVVFILYTVFTLNSIIVSDINANGIPIWFGWFDLYNLICK